MPVEDRVAKINRKLIRWSNYFCLGPVSKAYLTVDHHVCRRLRQWLCAKHKVPGPRHIVQKAVTCLTNNRSRMDYPTYRTQGLPITSALMESLIKEINWSVKGTEKFWNDPDGATPILALKTAALSDDNRQESRLYFPVDNGI